MILQNSSFWCLPQEEARKQPNNKAQQTRTPRELAQCPSITISPWQEPNAAVFKQYIALYSWALDIKKEEKFKKEADL